MDINKVLEETPSLKASAGSEAEELREAWQVAKETYDNEEALFMLKKKAENHDLKSTDLKVIVSADEHLYQRRLELVGLEAEYRKKELEINLLDDMFTSAKMLGRLQIAEMGSLNTELYTKKGEQNG